MRSRLITTRKARFPCPCDPWEAVNCDYLTDIIKHQTIGAPHQSVVVRKSL